METNNEILLEISEGERIEIKKAKKNFPVDCLETFSAFYNTNGGTILLGLAENKPNGYLVTGVDDPKAVIEEMFNILQNPDKISKNLITEQNIDILKYKGKNIIAISIPAAPFSNKPVYINNNPLKSFKRIGPNDYRLSKEEIDSMLRDASPESQDSKAIDILAKDCLDELTIAAYRNRFSARIPEHIFNNLSNEKFLCKLNAVVYKNNNCYPTLAGLLMFGKTEEIKKIIPYYSLEYINYGNDYSERWIDRVIYDGTWGEGNIFNFFQTVILKLYSTTTSNFSLEDNLITRQATSDIQVALRESFVNSLIHADYKVPDRIQAKYENNTYTFSNPGTLRISISEYYNGNTSAPRNPNLAMMFRMIGFAEEAGSGVPKILSAAKKNQFARPELSIDKNKVTLSFTTIPILELLVKKFKLNDNEISVLRAINKLGYAKRKEIEADTNLSRAFTLNALKVLIEDKIIESTGKSSATKYTISTEHISSKDKVIDALEKTIKSIKNS